MVESATILEGSATGATLPGRRVVGRIKAFPD